MMINLDYKTEIALEELIDFCRSEEILFRRQEADYSGETYLKSAVIQGIINMDLYTAVLPAIQNPHTDYELKLKLKK